MTIGEQLEYQKLNTEIQDSDKRQMEILGFIFTVSLAMIGYGSSAGLALVLLLPLIVTAPGQLMILHRFQMTRRMSTYIRCFLEGGAESPNYETRIIAFRRVPQTHYRSLMYTSQWACIQLLAGASLGLALWLSSPIDRWLILVVALAWIGFAIYTKRLYRYFMSGGGAEPDYYADWCRVREAEAGEPGRRPLAH